MAKKSNARRGGAQADETRPRRPARQVARPSAAVPVGSDAPIATLTARPAAGGSAGPTPRPSTVGSRIGRPSRAGSLPSINDYGYVFTDLRRIATLAAAAFAVLIALTFVVH